jgi:hypothetical protein
MKNWKEGYTQESEDIPGMAEEEEAGTSLGRGFLSIKERRMGGVLIQTLPPKDRRTWAF